MYDSDPDNWHNDLRGLTEADGRVLDHLLEQRFERPALAQLPDEDRPRGEAVLRLFNLLEDYPIDDEAAVGAPLEDDPLIMATLARVQRQVDRDRANLRIADARNAGRSRRRLPLPDFISVAAIILIAVGVMWPLLGEMQRRSVDARCVSNLTSLGTAMQAYARDFAGQAPMQRAGWGGGQQVGWLDTELLADLNYCEHGHLNCPGHAGTSRTGYSRQLVISGGRIALLVAGGEHPVVGDRNPLLDAVAADEGDYLNPRMNSVTHGKRGQNVLNVDGSVSWLDHPIVGADDNIWLVHGESTIRPDRVPDTENDIFLVHPIGR